MLNDGSGFKKVYLATGFTDLRKGIDGFAIGIVLLFEFMRKRRTSGGLRQRHKVLAERKKAPA